MSDADEGGSSSTPPKKQADQNAALKFFVCTDLVKQHWKCILCDWMSSHSSLRRKMQHLLGDSNCTVKKCPKEECIAIEDREEILSDLRCLDKKSAEKKARKRFAR